MSLTISSLDDQKRALSLIYDTGIVFLTYGILWALVVFLGGFDVHPAAPLNAIKAYKASWPDWFLWSMGGSAIAGALLFGVNPYRRGGNYGGAHFATEKEISKDLKLRGDTGLILGIHRRDYLRMDEPLSVLIYAPPGSGKTAGVIIPSLLSCGNSALVHDPKGELHDKTAGFRMRNRQRIIRFEPAAAVSAKWNPLGKEELPETLREKVSYIDRIANTLVNAGKQGDDYWTREARSPFVFFSLFPTHRDGETSLPAVRELALSQADPQGFVAELLENTPGVAATGH